MRDPYSILGVPKSASADEIKKSYRKLAKKHHPDLNPGNKEHEKRFKEITQAYDILGDSEKRAKFDQGDIDASGQERGGFYRQQSRRGGAGYNPFQNFDAQDIFSDLFRSARKNAGFFDEDPINDGPARGEDIQHSLRISFIDAARGVKRKVTLDGKAGKTIEITIPQGTADGQILRLKGQGLPGGRGEVAGDALIEIKVDADPRFEVKGSNIYTELPVTLYEAVLGAQVMAPTVDGPVQMTVPKGANSGMQLRLKNKGLIDPKSKLRGDQYVRLKIMLPEKIDPELRDFVAEWAEKNTYRVRKEES